MTRAADTGRPATLAYPNFTRDGQSVIGRIGRSIGRFSLRDRRLEPLADLGSIQTTSPILAAWWVGLDPQDAPIILQDLSTSEMYALEWEQP